jgi:APA family basic amino acid/polyamine antiporter
MGSLLIMAFSCVHAAHVLRGAWVQNTGVSLNLVLIVGFLVLALPRLHGHAAAPIADPPASGFATAFGVSLILVSYSYSGWNAAAYIGGEIRNPERNLPRSLLLGTLLVTALYVALNAVFVFSAPMEELAGKIQVGRLAAESLGGPTWGNAVTAIIALVLMMSVSSFVMAGPRICAKMATDGYLPSWLATQEGPPRHAILAQGGISLAMLATATFEGLLTYVGLTLSLITAATVAGLIVLRRRMGDSLRVPGWPWVPWLFLIAVLWICGVTLVQRPVAAAASLGTLALGFLGWRLSRSRAPRF